MLAKDDLFWASISPLMRVIARSLNGGEVLLVLFFSLGMHQLDVMGLKCVESKGRSFSLVALGDGGYH